MNPGNKLKVIITGATGMVGEGVLHECLLSDEVEKILVISRKPLGAEHPKLKTIIHPDFSDISSIESQVSGYDACFFCAGVSSIGKDEETFYKQTYTVTTGFANTIAISNPGMVFCYISGSGTDSSEKGRIMWARVKGKTENRLLQLPFRKVYNFRPGYMQPIPGLKHTLKYYKYFTWMYPFWRTVLPGYVCSLREVAQAMIKLVKNGYEKQILEVSDIVRMANL